MDIIESNKIRIPKARFYFFSLRRKNTIQVCSLHWEFALRRLWKKTGVERGESMTQYVKNINSYLARMKIKQSYISMKTGIDTKKLSRILTGVQDINSTDMDKISKALGRDTAFFLSNMPVDPGLTDCTRERIAFYAGEPAGRQEEIAKKLVKLMENIDEVLSAKARFLNLSKE